MLYFLEIFFKKQRTEDKRGIDVDRSRIVLKRVCMSQNESGVEVAIQKDREMSSWPDIVQYLLRSYAQPNNITDAILQLRATRNHKGEIGNAFSRRLN